MEIVVVDYTAKGMDSVVSVSVMSVGHMDMHAEMIQNVAAKIVSTNGVTALCRQI